MTDMLKKSEKINTSEGYVKSDTLTEQWKKGELTDGEYYVRTIDGIVLIDCYADYWDFIQDEQVEKILCEVPSYEEWQTEKRFAKDCFTREQEKEKEYLFAIQKIAQLKELLKRARDLIEQINWCESFYAYNDGLDEEIDEVLK